MSIQDLDDKLPIHDSGAIRALCGDPGHESWRRFRISVGIQSHQRKLSDKEAFLLFVRSYWRRVCKEAGVKLVRSPEYTDLLRVADQWVRSLQGDPTALLKQLIEANTFKGSDLSRAVELLTGKPRSEDTISRACKRAGLTYSRRGRYTKAQTLRIVTALS